MTHTTLIRTKKKTQTTKARSSNIGKTASNNSLNLYELHRLVGNRGVQRLMETSAIQRKLKIGKPNDKYEQEADKTADRVMSMPETKTVRRQPEEEKEETVQEKELRRQPEEEKEETVSAKSQSGGTRQVTPEVQNNINSKKGRGRPLTDSSRAFFEPRFNRDFSNVRLHTDSRAAETAKSINARAFTVGKDIAFGAGQYSPDTVRGKHLLAHELTHTVQKGKTIRLQKKPSSKTCKVPRALNYYKKGKGKKYSWGKTWIDALYEPLAPLNPELKKNAIDEGKIGEHFIILVCKAQEKLGVKPDGMVGTTTTRVLKKKKKATETLKGTIPLTEEQVKDAIAYNTKRFDPWIIGRIQKVLGGTSSGVVDADTIHLIYAWQVGSKLKKKDGKIGLRTMRSIVLELIREGKRGTAIWVIIDGHNFRTLGLVKISYVAGLVGDNATTAGPIPGDSTVEIGPLAFAQGYAGLVHTIAHELGHVKQRRAGIASQNIREFLGEAIEIISTGMFRENLAGFMNDARRALKKWKLMTLAERKANRQRFIDVRKRVRTRYNRASVADQVTHKATRDKYNAVIVPAP